MLKFKKRNWQVLWSIDFDYLDELTADELQWLKDFANEYYVRGDGPSDKRKGGSKGGSRLYAQQQDAMNYVERETNKND